MGKQFFLGMTKLKRNQQGAILIITVFIIILLSVLLMVMTEVGRIMIIREKTQTATDAAALASATSEVKRYVDLTVMTRSRKYATQCCRRTGRAPRRHTVCTPCGKNSTPHNVDKQAIGEEKLLIELGQWKNYCIPDSWSYTCNSYTLNDRWVEYERDIKTSKGGAAKAFFDANLPQGITDAYIEKVIPHDDKTDPAYPSVVVYATSKIKTLFPEFKGKPEYDVTTCSQGSTYYYKANDPNARWINPPKDACWEDW